jgi:hypothetical protein
MKESATADLGIINVRLAAELQCSADLTPQRGSIW